MPAMPTSCSACLTSSSLNGLMTAVTSYTCASSSPTRGPTTVPALQTLSGADPTGTHVAEVVRRLGMDRCVESFDLDPFRHPQTDGPLDELRHEPRDDERPGD